MGITPYDNLGNLYNVIPLSTTNYLVSLLSKGPNDLLPKYWLIEQYKTNRTIKVWETNNSLQVPDL